MAAPLRAPLCPAGHLPRNEGDHALWPFRQHRNLVNEATTRLISPLAGEMAGRPEGGNVERFAPGQSIVTK
jgi:hypothetical protein